jgi:hypothetical protein
VIHVGRLDTYEMIPILYGMLVFLGKAEMRKNNK